MCTYVRVCEHRERQRKSNVLLLGWRFLFLRGDTKQETKTNTKSVWMLFESIPVKVDNGHRDVTDMQTKIFLWMKDLKRDHTVRRILVHD